MTRNFDKRFREGMAASLFVKQMNQHAAPILKEYLGQAFQPEFRAFMAFQTWMFSREKLDNIANHCFDLAVSELIATAAKRDQKQLVGKKGLFGTGKTFYLRQLFGLWSENRHRKQPENGGREHMIEEANFDCSIKRAALTGLAQLEKASRDVFIWQYIDCFTPQQIGTITGKPQAAVKEALYHCFLDVERLCRRALMLPQTSITQPGYELLCAYFSNELTDEQETYFAATAKKQKEVQYLFQFFLALNYEAIPEEAVREAVRQFESDALSAGEFLTLVKRALEGRCD